MTSVGHGDQYPVTVAGPAVAVVLMITGIALFGVVAASIASYFVEQDQDRRVESRMDEIFTVLNRLEARLEAAERRAAATPGDSPGCPAVPGSSEALHLSRGRRLAGAPHEPG